MSLTMHKYDQRGLQLVNPAAFGLLFAETAPRQNDYEVIGETAVVSIDGPLAYEGGWWGETYSAIKSRVAAALADNAVKRVVMRINSPGGDVAGCFDTAKAIRAASTAAGKPLLAHVEGAATSAAYAIASAADQIVASESAIVGSIGVIWAGADVTQADAMQGVQVHIVTSGDRKADGNPHVSMNEAAHAAIQKQVDESAELFFALVASHRESCSVEFLRGLQAAVFLGNSAGKLIDRVQSFDELMATVATASKPEKAKLGVKMSEGSVRDALKQAAESDDEEVAKRAKKALAAYDEDESEEKAEDKKEDQKAEDETEEKKEANSAAATSIAQLAARVQELSGRLAKQDAELAASKIDSLLAARPDLDPELCKTLKGLGDPKKVAAIVNNIKPAAFTPRTAELAEQPLTPAGSQILGAVAKPNSLAAQMGLVPMQSAVVIDGNVQQFGVKVPAVK